MGRFEEQPYHRGSVRIADAVAERTPHRRLRVVGGGETLAVLARARATRYIDHVSTGGGAMLAFLAGERMPGIDVLCSR